MKDEIISVLESLNAIHGKVIKAGTSNPAEEKELLDRLHNLYKEIKNLIVVRLDAIGDSLLFVNSIKQIRQLFPKAKITYVCYLETKEIIDRCEYIDLPVYIDRKQLNSNKIYREKIYSTLLGYKFDLLINPLFSREFLAEEIVYFIKADIKLGLSGDVSNISPVLLNETNKWYDYILTTEEKHNKFELHRNTEIVRLLGGQSDETELPQLYTKQEDIDFISNFLFQYRIENYAVVFPGTKGGKQSIKYWGSEKYARIIDYIQQELNLKVVVLGGSDEEEICNEIVASCHTFPLVFQGQFSIWKSVEFLRYAKFYIGSDTSIAHFSASMKTPTVVLLGGGHFGRFFPYPDHKHVTAVYQKMECYNCNWQCTEKTNKCITNISIKEVKRAINEIPGLTGGKKEVLSTDNKFTSKIISQRGSLPKIDILLPPGNNHSWHLKEGWIYNLRIFGMLNKVFYSTPKDYDHFFEYLKRGATSDIILALGGDHHLFYLHDTPEKKELWNKYKKTKICYSYESTLESPYSFYKIRSQNATDVFSHFLVADENDVKFFAGNRKKAIWFPQFVDEKFFLNKTPFSKRKHKIFFKGKLWSEYKLRQSVIDSLSKARLIELVDTFLTNSQLIDGYNSYVATINPPGVFGGFNVRAFEAMACGSLLFQFIPANRPRNNGLFEHGKHLIYFDAKNINLLKEQMWSVLNNPSDYSDIALNGYNEVLENHTLTKRLKTLIEWSLFNTEPSYKEHESISEKRLIRKITPELSATRDFSDIVKVSAIVSAYNSVKYMEGCITDLIEQTLYKRGELEIVIVNTGSEQDEDSIVNKYISKYNNIKYIKIENRETIYSAWNRGIKAASGKYITNANTDDRHKPDALEIMCYYLEDEPDIDVVYANQYYTTVVNDRWDSRTKKTEQLWADFDPDFLLFGCFIGPQPMWRKSLHDKFGYFTEGLQVVGDYEFWLRISRQVKFSHLREILGLYYYSNSSAEHRNKELTDKEHTSIQNYYMGQYIESIAEIKRISAKLEPYKNSGSFNAYYNLAIGLLESREKALNYEESLVNFMVELGKMPEGILCQRITEKVEEINSVQLPINREKYLELLYLYKGAICMQQQKVEEARSSFENALSVNNDSAQACVGLGDIFKLENELEKAKIMFELAVKNDPQNKIAVESLEAVNQQLDLV